MSNSISKDGNYKLESGSLYIRRKARNNVLYWEPVYKTMANNVNDAIEDYTGYLLGLLHKGYKDIPNHYKPI